MINLKKSDYQAQPWGNVIKLVRLRGVIDTVELECQKKNLDKVSFTPEKRVDNILTLKKKHFKNNWTFFYSTASVTTLSLTPRCQWTRGVWLSSVNDTSEIFAPANISAKSIPNSKILNTNKVSRWDIIIKTVSKISWQCPFKKFSIWGDVWLGTVRNDSSKTVR